MFETIIQWLEGMAQTVPLPVFVTVGSVVEELIAPIPSPLVATLAGSIASAQEMGIPALLGICFLAAAAKTLGASFFYVLGIWFKDLAVPRFGKYIGVTEADLEKFGAHFNGSRRDVFLLFFIRSIPVMPSTPISLLCGTLDINVRTFTGATLCGFFIRELTFMLIGYHGLAAVDALMSGIDTAETVLKIVIVVGFIAVLGWLYWKRKTGHSFRWLGGKR